MTVTLIVITAVLAAAAWPLARLTARHPGQHAGHGEAAGLALPATWPPRPAPTVSRPPRTIPDVTPALTAWRPPRPIPPGCPCGSYGHRADRHQAAAARAAPAPELYGPVPAAPGGCWCGTGAPGHAGPDALGRATVDDAVDSIVLRAVTGA